MDVYDWTLGANGGVGANYNHAPRRHWRVGRTGELTEATQDSGTGGEARWGEMA